MRDIRGCIAAVSRLHDTRMRLYAKPTLTEEDKDTINEIDRYLDTICRLAERKNEEYVEAIHRKRHLFEYQEGAHA